MKIEFRMNLIALQEEGGSEPVWQRLNSSLSSKEILQRISSCDVNLLRHPERSEPINPLPVPQRTSSVDPDRATPGLLLADVSHDSAFLPSTNPNPGVFTKSSHMQIILGEFHSIPPIPRHATIDEIDSEVF